MNIPVKIIGLFLISSCLFSCSKKSSSDNENSSEKQKILTGEFLENHGIHALCKTHDNNFAIVARKGASRQLYVAMLNSSLTILWEKLFDSDIDNAGGIIEASDGGLVIASNKQVSNDPFQINYCLNLMKINQSGEILWQKNYLFESSYWQEYPLLQTTDGGFIIGVSYHIPEDPGRFYPTLFKVDQQGDSLWIKAIPDLFNCPVSDIAIAPGQDFLVSGSCAISRTSPQGNLVWSNNQIVHVTPVSVLQDGSAVMLRNRYGDTGFESLLTKVDSSGNIVWESLLMTGWNNESFNLCQSAGSGFIVTEKNNNTVFLIKTDQNGKKISERNLDCYRSCGLVPWQGMYCLYTSRLNSSQQYVDLVISLLK